MSELIERRLAEVEKVIGIQGEKIDKVEEEIKEIKLDIKSIIKLLSARPTWLIVALIMIPANVTVGLIVYVLTTHH